MNDETPRTIPAGILDTMSSTGSTVLIMPTVLIKSCVFGSVMAPMVSLSRRKKSARSRGHQLPATRVFRVALFLASPALYLLAESSIISTPSSLLAFCASRTRAIKSRGLATSGATTAPSSHLRGSAPEPKPWLRCKRGHDTRRSAVYL